MEIIGILLMAIFVISAILMIVLIMLQDDQGEGLGGLFGGGSSTPFGSRSGNVLTKATSIFAVVFLFAIVGLALINRTKYEEDVLNAARSEEAAERGEWFLGTADTEEIGDGEAILEELESSETEE